VGATLAARAAPTVIVLSLDGVRFDYPDRPGLPTFARLAREGVRADALVPVFPSITFPSHVSLATGAPPDRHGIVNNKFHDAALGDFAYDNARDGRFLEAEPLWVAAERQGVRAATFFWVGSQTPWHGTAAHYRRAPFDPTISEREKVDQILAWLDLPAGERPGLIMSWWHGADGPGHENGPDAPEVLEALHGQDAELARLLSGIDARQRWDETTLLVVSDHGMLAASESVDAADLLERAGIGGRAINAMALAFVYLDDPARATAAAEKLGALDPRVRALTRSALPAELRIANPRVGDVVLFTDPPVAFLEAWEGLDFRRRLAWLWGGAIGVHGYDATRVPEMRGIFFALGRGIPHGQHLGPIRALDVAPTVARLLGIEPPQASEGRPIAELGVAGL
jgi:arylsulfatase A-like enzyme